MRAQSGVRRFGGESRPDRFGVPVDAGEGVDAEFLLGREPQCIVIAHDRVVQLSRAGRCLPLCGRGGAVGSVVLEDLGQDVDRGRRAECLRIDQAVRVTVESGSEIDVIRLTAAGDADVQRLARLLAGRDEVGRVGGHALGAVDGGGVSELDVLGDVVSGQLDGASEFHVPRDEGAACENSLDPPAVAVLDPVAARDHESAAVAASDDDVPC